ncbi:MAG: hypothetical protein ABEL04_09755 [Salinibacter sp.]|uniref:hypothetical protein n=1 Tax=Salinibacter sp. TaxID=2065818 RepID=UPI0035D50898
MDAAQICRRHHRWSSEIVFRRLSGRLQLDHFVSRDPWGIIRQIVTALIVWELPVIHDRDNTKFSPEKLMRQVRHAQRQCQKHGVSPFD